MRAWTGMVTSSPEAEAHADLGETPLIQFSPILFAMAAPSPRMRVLGIAAQPNDLPTEMIWEDTTLHM